MVELGLSLGPEAAQEGMREVLTRKKNLGYDISISHCIQDMNVTLMRIGRGRFEALRVATDFMTGILGVPA